MMMLQQLEAVQGGGAMRISPVAPCKLQLHRAAPQRVTLCGVSRMGNGPRCRMAEPSGKPAPMGQKTAYKDSWMENLILRLCVRRLGKITGMSTTVKGYDGFVEVTRKVMQTRSPLLQRAASMRVLHSAIPQWLLKIVRRFLTNNQKTAETFAAATLYAEWLVGPCEVKEVEVNGVLQKSGVLIKKCRYLESSNCVGMCVNMCKVPTQDFFTNSLGVPVTMTPNFEDMSCEMVYGQAPPPLEEDPALQQPCFLAGPTACPTARKKALTCSKSPPPS